MILKCYSYLSYDVLYNIYTRYLYTVSMLNAIKILSMNIRVGYYKSTKSIIL